MSDSGVSNKVDGLRRSVNTVSVLAPVLQKTSSELESTNLRLAKGNCFQLFASDGLVHSLEGNAESAHTETSMFVGSGPDDIVVGEEDGRALIQGLRTSTDNTTLGHEKIKNDLLITSPVTAVGKDEDGLNLDVLEVALTRVLQVVLGHGAERCGVGVVLDDVSRSDNVLEAIALSDLTALVALTTNDEDSVVFASHLLHGCVAANELTR
jgi:hypothetical protein